MSKTVEDRIRIARERVVAAQLRGDLRTPEREERAAQFLRKEIRSAIALRTYDLWKENGSILEACRIAVRESGLKIPEADVVAMAQNLEGNWEKFVQTAPVEVISDAEFAELLSNGSGKGTIIA